MRENWTHRTWGAYRTILGLGMIIGFFLPWLGGCSPQNGLDLLLNHPRNYYGSSGFVTEFPDTSNRIGLFLMLVIGLSIFIAGILTTAGLLKKTFNFSMWTSLVSSYFSVKILFGLFALRYLNALYDSITVGLPLYVLCSIAVVAFGLGEFFSSRAKPSDTS